MRAGLISCATILGLGAYNGGFFPESWGPAVVVLAWAAALQLLLARDAALSRREVSFLALACGVAAWTALGAAWSDSVTLSLLEAERALVTVAALLALLLARDREWTLRGVLAATVALSAWDLLGGDPLGYANGAGVLAAVGIPLSLRDRRTWPALVVLAPELALSGSRGAWLALALAAVVGALRRPVLVVPAAAVVLAAAWIGDVRRGEYYPVAIDQARAAPLAGTGAGTWNEWWLARRPTAHDAQDAHSVYLETLGEQGVVGLALLLALLAVPLGSRPRDRLALAAYAAFAVHAAVDWDRELVAVWLAGLAVGAALLPHGPLVTTRHKQRTAAGILAAAALSGVGVLGGLTHALLAEARTAARAGDFQQAEALAGHARTLEPWSSLPLEAIGEAQLAAGRRRDAAATLAEATRKDPRRWRLWHDLAQASGSRRAGQAAKRLNPLGGE